jgi:hypothetical protein
VDGGGELEETDAMAARKEIVAVFMIVLCVILRFFKSVSFY